MTEILTESFCERCGTRYTFESMAPRQNRMGRIRVLGRGLKNFVMSDDSSLDEALAAARSDAEREATAEQLDAFHRTFNFCMSCRQYTCANCWNVAEARCLSCAPVAATDAPGPAEDISVSASALELLDRHNGHDHDEGVGLLEADDLRIRIGDGPDDPGPAPDATIREAGPVGPADADLAAMAASSTLEADGALSEPAVIDDAGVAPDGPAMPAVPTGDRPEEPAIPESLEGLRPGETLDDAIAAYEADLEAASLGGGRGVDVVGTPTWPVPVPDVAAPETAPEPAASPSEPPAPVTPPSQPAAPVAPPPTPVPVAPAERTTPQWPTGPRWPTAMPGRPDPSPVPGPPVADPLAALMARQVTEAMWAASSRDLALNPVAPAPAAPPSAGVAPCTSCGISLSANARFCRRCGTAQPR